MVKYVILDSKSFLNLRRKRYRRSQKVTNLRTVRSENDNYVPYLTVFSCVPFKRLKALLSVSLVTSGMWKRAIIGMIN